MEAEKTSFQVGHKDSWTLDIGFCDCCGGLAAILDLATLTDLRQYKNSDLVFSDLNYPNFTDVQLNKNYCAYE